jgi:hypothetical protein
MKRREFITLAGVAAIAGPLAARAQQAPVALVGLLSGFQLDDRLLGAIRQGLKEAGFIEGRERTVLRFQRGAHDVIFPKTRGVTLRIINSVLVGGRAKSLSHLKRPHQPV